VPEAAVDEDCETSLWKYDVRFTRQLRVPSPSANPVVVKKEQ